MPLPWLLKRVYVRLALIKTKEKHHLDAETSLYRNRKNYRKCGNAAVTKAYVYALRFHGNDEPSPPPPSKKILDAAISLYKCLKRT